MEINLNHKKFKALANSENGEVSGQTIFHYFQERDRIWGEYAGGSIRKGFLIGKIVGSSLEFSYQHVNDTLEIMTGTCKSLVSQNPEGKILLSETWEWTCKDFSKGTSTLMEIQEK